MKNKFLLMGLVALGLGITSCSDDDKNENTLPEGTAEVEISIDEAAYAGNEENWHKYTVAVANLLVKDATDLNEAWINGYADEFKNAKGSYRSYNDCLAEIINGCADISNEVGTAKIGDLTDCAHQASQSLVFLRQEHWSGLLFPSPGDLPNPRMRLASPALVGGFFTTEPQGNPSFTH